MRLVVRAEPSAATLELHDLLRDLSFVAASPADGRPALRLVVRHRINPPMLPAGRDLFDRQGLRGTAVQDDVYVTEGTSLMRVEVDRGRGTAWIARDFAAGPPLVRQRFWTSGLLALLRGRGLYPLHAAALVDMTGTGVLLAGPSGSGKSTLAIGLIHQGWRYLSDDAVLLRERHDGVAALVLRRPFSVVAGGQKRRVDVQESCPDQFRPECRPTVLVFPRIAHDARSTLRPLARAVALRRLLAQSGLELADRASMPRQMALLAALVRQARPYELCAGRDLHRRPALLADLVANVRIGCHGADHRRAHQPL